MTRASADTCEKVEDKINYKFKERNILCEALLADGRHIFGTRIMEEANKQIAVIGEAVMNLVIFERAYGIRKSRAQMDEQSRRIGSNYNLNAKGRAIGLAESLQHAEGLEAANITNQMVVTAVKAILGAVWRDSNDLGVVRGVMGKLALFEVLSPLDR